MILKSALMCLALSIYYEGRGEPEIGQFSIAEVVMNRANERNLNICQVIKQPKQFSWVTTWNHKIPSGQDWNKSVNIAETVLNGKTTNYTGGALYFRHKSIKGRVASSIVIGNHKFYKHSG